MGLRGKGEEGTGQQESRRGRGSGCEWGDSVVQGNFGGRAHASWAGLRSSGLILVVLPPTHMIPVASWSQGEQCCSLRLRRQLGEPLLGTRMLGVLAGG